VLRIRKIGLLLFFALRTSVADAAPVSCKDLLLKLNFQPNRENTAAIHGTNLAAVEMMLDTGLLPPTAYPWESPQLGPRLYIHAHRVPKKFKSLEQMEFEDAVRECILRAEGQAIDFGFNALLNLPLFYEVEWYTDYIKKHPHKPVDVLDKNALTENIKRVIEEERSRDLFLQKNSAHVEAIFNSKSNNPEMIHLQMQNTFFRHLRERGLSRRSIIAARIEAISRKGVLLYFSTKIFNDFKITTVDMEEGSQILFKKEKGLSADYVSAIQPLGPIENKILEKHARSR
jgi:hypothetical protein